MMYLLSFRLDAYRCILIANNIQAIPLALQITHICGNIMSKTLQGGRAERNSYLLLHAFHEEGKFSVIYPTATTLKSGLGHLPPEKLSLKAKKAVTENEKGEEKTGKEKKKAKYAGGLGLFSKFLFLDLFQEFIHSPGKKYELVRTSLTFWIDAKTQIFCIFRKNNGYSVRHLFRKP